MNTHSFPDLTRNMNPIAHVVFDYHDAADRPQSYRGWVITAIAFSAEKAERWAAGNCNDKGVGSETHILTMDQDAAYSIKARGLLTEREMDAICNEYQLELAE